ncbi:MAG: outer membrane protein assembly factor BamA [Burkholderiaceae bacterium]|jgi:outer membrane protein insertion porin family
MLLSESAQRLNPLIACVATMALATAATKAWAIDPFTIKDIRVEGLQRSDPGTVFAALPFRVGDLYSEEKGAAAVRALFATGLFKDVRLQVEAEVLVVVVEERPIIGRVDFAGIKEFDKDTLVKALKDAGISEGQPFDRALVDRAEQEIKRQYLSRSLYGAEVVTTVTPQERNRVSVTFTTTEGEPAKIKEIRILGARVFKESDLVDLLDQTRSGWFTWYTKRDRYARSKLNADLETLRAHYTNRGYLEFAVESTQVTMSPDKQSISIVITVREGQPYTVTAVRLAGELLGRDDELKSLITVKPGSAYRSEDVAESQRRITDRFGVYGYAFARVEARQDINRETGQVELTLVADPGRRAYVRRINISGNTSTRDEVIRREFRQFESSWYDSRKIRLSKERLERMAYFKDVNIDTQEVPGTADQVDLTATVTEKATGNFQIGAGYSSLERLTISGSLQKENFLGTGHYLGLQVNSGRFNRNLTVSTVDPYFTKDGVSRAIDVFYRTARPFNTQGETYELMTPGTAVRFGIPFSEVDTVFVGLGAEQTRIKGSAALPNLYFLYRENFGSNSTAFPLTVGWARDERDNVLTPTRGRLQRVNLELSALGDAQYTRTNLQYQQYFPFWNRKLTLGVNAELGWGAGLGNKPYPIFKNFYGGGLGSVRVFQQGSLGPVDVTGAYIGGSKRFNLNTELYLPVPGTGNDKSLRLFAFGDAGNVWADTERPDFDSLRAAAGLGLSWISPVGPLKLSWGTPIKYRPQDRIQRFQFQIGTAF